MANTPNPQQPGQKGDQPIQPGQPNQPAKKGHEVPAPPLHRTDTKEATMGKPGSAGTAPNRRDEGETQTQETEFKNESDGADIDQAAGTGGANGPGRKAEAKPAAPQTTSDQNRPADPGFGAQGGQQATGNAGAM